VRRFEAARGLHFATLSLVVCPSVHPRVGAGMGRCCGADGDDGGCAGRGSTGAALCHCEPGNMLVSRPLHWGWSVGLGCGAGGGDEDCAG